MEEEFIYLCECKFKTEDWYYSYERVNKKIIATICPECTITVEKKLLKHKY